MTMAVAMVLAQARTLVYVAIFHIRSYPQNMVGNRTGAICEYVKCEIRCAAAGGAAATTG